jgi:hypothetical protein
MPVKISGRFIINNLKEAFVPQLIPPAYQSDISSAGGSVEGDDLNRLGYKQGVIKREGNTITYTQRVGMVLCMK